MNLAKRIQTASHITPWQMEDRRMDTIQSFDADFSEEPQIVLLNFKHLLFSYRWNSSTTLNYLEWLITVTNDIFFYFLKQSEPMYAYHALKISEYYVKNVLQKSKTVNQFKNSHENLSSILKDIQNNYLFESDENKADDSRTSVLSRTSKAFKALYTRMMNPVLEIYTHGLSSIAVQSQTIENESLQAVQNDLRLLVPPLKTLEEKIKVHTDFIGQLPFLVPEGDGGTAFQFQKNYVLLAYYCLIQFRNYQASNFNILFLILSSYIVKNHVNASFIDGLQKFTCVILQNFNMLEKTDELDLFFGKCGSNRIIDAPPNIFFVQKWIQFVVPHQSVFAVKLLHKK